MVDQSGKANLSSWTQKCNNIMPDFSSVGSAVLLPTRYWSTIRSLCFQSDITCHYDTYVIAPKVLFALPVRQWWLAVWRNTQSVG